MVSAPPPLFDVGPWRDLYPFESRFIERRGVRMHYLDEGPPEPRGTVVCVHGNPTWSLYFRELVLALRATHRVIVPDHVGCGLSDKPGDDAYTYTLASRVDDLEALLTHLAVTGPISLIVHDWGGMIGMTWATRHSDQVERIVVMNTAAFHLPAHLRFPWSLALVRNPLGAFLVRAFNAFSLVASFFCVTARPLPPRVRAAYRAPYNSWAHRIATLRFVQDIPLRPGDTSYALVSATDAALQKLAGKPMLLLWGERDFVFHNGFRDEWVRRFPAARLVSFPEAGHYVLEDARDAILPLVLEHLAGCEALTGAATPVGVQAGAGTGTAGGGAGGGAQARAGESNP